MFICKFKINLEMIGKRKESAVYDFILHAIIVPEGELRKESYYILYFCVFVCER